MAMGLADPVIVDSVGETDPITGYDVPRSQSGFIDGTHVVSNLGWQPVEKLNVGDKVLSFDNGMQPITGILHETKYIPEGLHYTDQCPVMIPEGALRNRRPLWMMPDQGILIESDIILDDTGDPFAVVPAKALVGHRGITLAPLGEEVRVTTLTFHQDEVVYVEGGVLAHSAKPCDQHIDQKSFSPAYQTLKLRAAKFVVACHMDDNEPAGLTYHPEEIASVLRHRERPAYTS